MRCIALVLILFFSLQVHAKDLTGIFDQYYQSEKSIKASDIQSLSDTEIILVPGVLSEVFSGDVLDLSRFTSQYFGDQVDYFKGLGLKVTRLPSSTYSVAKTKKLIHLAMEEVIKENKKVLFITHSLGGLALLDYLFENPITARAHLRGIIFLQSPFYGAPVASVFLSNPFYLKTLLEPVFPFFNFSEETIKYLSLEYRSGFMSMIQPQIDDLSNMVPIVTVAGIVNGSPSLFLPGSELVEHGCVLNAFGRCLTPKLYKGPNDLSDGLVPLKSSKLVGVDYIELQGVDHAEVIVNVPFTTYKRKKLTEALMRVFFDKINGVITL